VRVVVVVCANAPAGARSCMCVRAKEPAGDKEMMRELESPVKNKKAKTCLNRHGCCQKGSCKAETVYSGIVPRRF
jgi:hypothetical protein